MKPQNYSLRYFLSKYQALQDKILLIYRKSEDSSWSNRCFYLEENYDPNIPYNHRGILRNEVVIEFDDKDKDKNRENAMVVYKRLFNDGFSCLVAYTGGKSIHVHTFVDVGQAKNLAQLKKEFMRYYCKDLPLPDLQLASDNHPVRAEFGLHEKTGNTKIIVTIDKSYPKIKKIPTPVWDAYVESMQINTKRAMTQAVNNIDQSEGFKHLLASDQFRANEDGRSRALFMLIYVLKQQDKYKDDKESLGEFLANWYRYANGTKLTEKDIKSRVNAAYAKNAVQYTPGRRYLNELLESVGKKELIDK